MQIDNDPGFITSPFSSQAQQTTKALELLPQKFQDQLQVLSLLTDQLFKSTSAHFSDSISYLTQNPPAFDLSKSSLVKAYVQDFTEEEKTIFLEIFFRYFDPKNDLDIPQSQITNYWEGLVRYLCEHYMNSQAQAQDLTCLFSKKQLKKLNSTSEDVEKELESRFDTGLQVFEDFLEQPKNPHTQKFLLGSYISQLIMRLEHFAFEPCHTPEDLNALKSSFNEIFFYLLCIPFHSLRSEYHLFSIMKEDVLRMQPQEIHQKLVSKIIEYLKQKPENFSKETELLVQRVLSQVDFY